MIKPPRIRVARAKKVYVILDDFGSVEALRENMGKHAPPNLNTKYVITFLLAEEY